MCLIYNQVVTALSGVYIASHLGPAEYGVVSLARTALVILATIAPLGLDLSLQRYLAFAPPNSLQRYQVNLLRLTVLPLSVLIILACTAGFGSYAEATWFPNSGFSAVLTITMLALPPLVDQAVLGGAFRGIMNPLPSLIASYAVQPTARFILALILFQGGASALDVAYATSMAAILSAATVWIIAARAFPVGRKTFTLNADIKQLLLYSPILAISMVVTTITRSTDALTLGVFSGTTDVGIYNVALLIGQLIVVAGAALGQSLPGQVANAYKSNKPADVETLLKNTALLASVFAAPVYVGVALWGNRASLVLGAAFEIDAVALTLICSTQFAYVIFGFGGLALSMTGHQNPELRILLVGMVIQIFASLLLVPHFGIGGAAVSSLTTTFSILFMRGIAVKRLIGISSVPIYALLPPIVAAALGLPIFFVTRELTQTSLAWTCIAGTAFVSIYFVVILLGRPLVLKRQGKIT
ncbi:oligosaccharide flippase family protein [Devosia sediminis]|nr:oligosaccharide flippase family protein [Devosia sediminis]